MRPSLAPPFPNILALEHLRLDAWCSFALKRAFDLLASAVGLILLAPLFAVLAILIKRESPGPVFYRGPRMGKNGKVFHILKFRTMYERPESYRGARITARDDERITPLGRWLRETKLNELPQLWNVLMGEMSLVGPRPEDPQIAMNWPGSARREILSVLPGITSPASILYRNEEALLSTANLMEKYFKDILPDKLRLDRLYVRNRSFIGDLDILFWTLSLLVPRVFRQRIPESLLFAGPLSRLVRRHLSWFVVDLGISLASVSMVGLIGRSLQPLNWGLAPLVVLALTLAVLFSSVNLLLGLDRIIWSRASAEDGLALTLSNSMVTVCLLVLNRMLPAPRVLDFPPLPAEMIAGIGILTGLGFLAARYRWRLLTSVINRWLSGSGRLSSFAERVLIVGAGEGAQIANGLLRQGQLKQAFSIIGMVDDDAAVQGMRLDGCPVLGGIGDLPALVRQHRVSLLLFTITSAPRESQQQWIELCTIPGVRLVFLNDLINSVQTHLAPRPMERVGLAGLSIPTSPLGMRIINGMEE